MKKFTFAKPGAAFAVAGLFFSILYFSLQSLPESVFFESLESKTSEGQSVFNEIQFQSGEDHDIWMMRQNQQEFARNSLEWDRLAIVVDKKSSPAKAQFYQLKPGKMTMPVQLEELVKDSVPLKATCMACHANGPRAIRIQQNSVWIQPGFGAQIKTALWNLRIKTYGRMQSEEGIHFMTGVEFSNPMPVLTRPLQLKSCRHCHSEQGLRNPLTHQQARTVSFLVKHQQMPPFPFTISKEDQAFLDSL